MSQKIDLSGFRYRPDHFTLGCPIVQDALWNCVLRPENIIRMEAVTAVGRPAVEALSGPLVSEFGREIAQSSIKQMIGHMVRQVMEALDYEVDRHHVRINRPGLFATGKTFRRPDQPRSRSVIVTAGHRQEWLNAAETDEFPGWRTSSPRQTEVPILSGCVVWLRIGRSSSGDTIQFSTGSNWASF
jgi:hypothetical protein